MKQPEPVPPLEPPVVVVVLVEPPVVVVEVVEPPVVEPLVVVDPLPLPVDPPPVLVVVVVTGATPVTVTCLRILEPEFVHPTVRLAENKLAELGVARTTMVQLPPAGILTPQVLIARSKAKMPSLLLLYPHPVAATVELVLATVKVAEVVDKVPTVTFPRLWTVAGLTVRVTDPEPPVVPDEPPPAEAVVLV
jgi:hypothetical protein